MIEHLAQELGHRGVTVNSIIPTTVDNAGVFTGGAEQRIKDWVAGFRPMPRMATVEDVVARRSALFCAAHSIDGSINRLDLKPRPASGEGPHIRVLIDQLVQRHSTAMTCTRLDAGKMRF